MYIVLLSFNIYCDPATSSCKVVVNSIYPHVCSIITIRKDVCIWYYAVFLSNNLSYVVIIGPPVVRLSNQVLTGSPEVTHPE